MQTSASCQISEKLIGSREAREKESAKELPKKKILCHQNGNTETVMETLNFLFWKFV